MILGTNGMAIDEQGQFSVGVIATVAYIFLGMQHGVAINKDGCHNSQGSCMGGFHIAIPLPAGHQGAEPFGSESQSGEISMCNVPSKDSQMSEVAAAMVDGCNSLTNANCVGVAMSTLSEQTESTFLASCSTNDTTKSMLQVLIIMLGSVTGGGNHCQLHAMADGVVPNNVPGTGGNSFVGGLFTLSDVSEQTLALAIFHDACQSGPMGGVTNVAIKLGINEPKVLVHAPVKSDQSQGDKHDGGKSLSSETCNIISGPSTGVLTAKDKSPAPVNPECERNIMLGMLCSVCISEGQSPGGGLQHNCLMAEKSDETSNPSTDKHGHNFGFH